MKRREFLTSASGMLAALSAVPASADDGPYDILLPRVRLRDGANGWDFGPGGDTNLLRAFSETVRCRVKLHTNTRNESPDTGDERHFNAIVHLGQLDEMSRYPLLFLTGTGPYRLDRQERDTLKAYIEQGGFVLMDECASPRRADEFYEASITELDFIFGRSSVAPIADSHEVWRNVFDLTDNRLMVWDRRDGSQQWSARQGRTAVADAVGLFIDTRLAAFVSNSDIHCGWTDPNDAWRKRANHEVSIKAGVNILMYALSH